jgi:hypothetical protein
MIDIFRLDQELKAAGASIVGWPGGAIPPGHPTRCYLVTRPALAGVALPS